MTLYFYFLGTSDQEGAFISPTLGTKKPQCDELGARSGTSCGSSWMGPPGLLPTPHSLFRGRQGAGQSLVRAEPYLTLTRSPERSRAHMLFSASVAGGQWPSTESDLKPTLGGTFCQAEPAPSGTHRGPLCRRWEEPPGAGPGNQKALCPAVNSHFPWTLAELLLESGRNVESFPEGGAPFAAH